MFTIEGKLLISSLKYGRPFQSVLFGVRHCFQNFFHDQNVFWKSYASACFAIPLGNGYAYRKEEKKTQEAKLGANFLSSGNTDQK